MLSFVVALLCSVFRFCDAGAAINCWSSSASDCKNVHGLLESPDVETESQGVSLLQTHVQLQGNVHSGGGLAENRTSAPPKDGEQSMKEAADNAKTLSDKANAIRKKGKKQLEKAKDRFGDDWKDKLDAAKKWTDKFDEFKDTIDGFKDKFRGSQLKAVKTLEAVPTVDEGLQKDLEVEAGLAVMLQRVTMVSKDVPDGRTYSDFWANGWDYDDPFWNIIPDWEERFLRAKQPKPPYEWTQKGIDGVKKHGHFEEYGEPAVGEQVPTNFGDELEAKLLKEGWTKKVENLSKKWHHQHLPPLLAVGTAVLTTLTIGGSDAIWLMPFFIGQKKWIHTFWYIVFMEFTVIVSFCIKSGMIVLAKANPGMPVSKILNAIASVIMTLFSVYLFRDWWNEEAEDDEEEKDLAIDGRKLSDDAFLNEGDVYVPEVDTAPSPRADDRGCLPNTKDAPKGQSGCHVQHHEMLGLGMLFVISIVASMTNFAVYSFLLYESVMNVGELSVGVVVGSAIIAAVSHVALVVKPLRRIVERIPLWIIFLCLSLCSYYVLAFD